MSDLFAFLDSNNISYHRCDHPAVFTTAEAAEKVPPLPGAATKNLFLRDQKGNRHFLVVVGHDTPVDLRALAPVLRSTKLSMGSPERLMKHLGIEPGAVSLLALVNDATHAVEVFIDRDLWRADAIQMHPLVNTATLVIARDEVDRFMHVLGHAYKVVAVPGPAGPPGHR